MNAYDDASPRRLKRTASSHRKEGIAQVLSIIETKEQSHGC